MVNLALYIGAFDPFHRTHLAEALYASHYLDADVGIIAVKESTTKQVVLSLEQRQEIINISILGYPRLYRLDESEQMDRNDAMIFFGRRYNVFELMGLDAFEWMRTFECADRIQDFSDIVVTERPGYTFTCIDDYVTGGRSYCAISASEAPLRMPLKASGFIKHAFVNPRTGRYIYYIGFPTEGISSTLVRTLSLCGEDVDYLLANGSAASAFKQYVSMGHNVSGIA